MYQQKEKNYRQAIMEQARDADQAKGKDADKAGPANGIPVQGAAEQTLQIQSLGKRPCGSPFYIGYISAFLLICGSAWVLTVFTQINPPQGWYSSLL